MVHGGFVKAIFKLHHDFLLHKDEVIVTNNPGERESASIKLINL